MADKITIKFKGVPEALSNIKKWEEKKLAQVSDDLKTTAFKIEGTAKRNGAGQWIDPTGRLDASISTNWSGSNMNEGKTGAKAESGDGIGQPSGEKNFVYVVGSRVEYSAFQEFGFHGTIKVKGTDKRRAHTRNVNYAGKPYLYPAYHANKNDAIKRIKETLKRKF